MANNYYRLTATPLNFQKKGKLLFSHSCSTVLEVNHIQCRCDWGLLLTAFLIVE